MASRKTINDIEEWVKTQSISATKTDNGTLNQQIKILQTIKAPPELAGWNIYATSGNENDCMIHSLLIDTSPTFRTLKENERNIIANSYRRTEFSQIPGVDKSRANSSVFLEDKDLQAFGNYYEINILVYTPSRNEFQQVSNKHNGEFILIHYNGSTHYSAMSTASSFFIDLALADQLVGKYSTPTETFCEYNTNDLIITNGNVEAVVNNIYTQDVTNKITGSLQNVCTSLDVTYFPPNNRTEQLPIEQFLTPQQKAERTRLFGTIVPARPVSSTSSNPFAPSSSKPRAPTSAPPPPGKTRAIPELFTPPAPPKPCPPKSGTLGTGFSETLECAVAAPPAPGTITSFWNQKIIETINILKEARHKELMKGDDNAEPIFNNYPEFKTLKLDNTGKVIVPTIDEDRVRDYTSNEAEFNQVIKTLQERVKQITAFKVNFDNNFLLANNQLNILTSMLQYPQNSQLENYFLITDFVDTRQIANTLLMGRTLKLPLKNPLNFVALFVLFSRYGLEDGILKKATALITTNKWKELYSDLFTEFSYADDINFGTLSRRILAVFTAFLTKNQNIITDSFIAKLRDGTYMYEIYKNGYENAELLQDNAAKNVSGREKAVAESSQELKTRKSQFALSRQIIQERTRTWLETPFPDIRTIPTSFIFDRYTEEEKKFMIQENAICAEIAELTGKLGKVNVPQMQIPHDFFIKESKENDKLASFLEETGPNISKDILNERRRLFFEGRGPFVGLAGGKGRGRKTKRSKHFRIRKNTRNNRKTRCKK